MKFHTGIAALVAIGVLAAVGVSAQTGGTVSAARSEKQEQIKRGEYLVLVGGCNDCHTPMKMGPKGPERDMSRMLSGHPEKLEMGPVPKMTGGWNWAGAPTLTAFAGPWGISYAMNLTPDKVTGIGIWDEALFIKTLRTGKHWGTSRPILPPMPWDNFAKMTDSDLKAVYAYLRSIPPVRNQVPDAVVAPHP